MFVVFIGSSHAQIDTTTYKTLTDSVFSIGDRLLIRNVHFTLNGGGRIQDYSRPILDSVALFLTKNPSLIVELALFTDIRGTAQDNKELSKRRAQVVYDFMVNQCGVNRKQIIPVGYGSSEPVISIEQINTTTDKAEFERFHAVNRRMELRVIGFWDDCSDLSYLKSSCSLLNWPHNSGGTFSKRDSGSIQISCSCELIDFEFVVFNRWGKIVNQSALKLEGFNSGNSRFLHSFQIQTATLQSSTYVYYIRKLGSDKTEDVLFQGHFNLVE